MKWQLSILIVFSMIACSPLGDTKTSNAASRAEVRFISLPESASEIKFWDDGNNRMATFKVPELDFIQMFPDKIFTEIKEADNKYYWNEGYGDLKQAPYRKPPGTKAFKGFYFKTIKENGGGTTLIYDREKNIAFVYLVRW